MNKNIPIDRQDIDVIYTEDLDPEMFDSYGNPRNDEGDPTTQELMDRAEDYMDMLRDDQWVEEMEL